MFIKKNIFIFLILCGLAWACSSQKDTFTNRLYHNITAKFNAYFLAKKKIDEVKSNIKKAYQEDYSQVLPVFYPIDSAVIDSNEELLEEAREMASKAIDWHRISKWVDDSYFLIGKIDYLQAKTDDAINTFKYLNVNSKEDEVRHQALIQLLRIFIDQRKYDDANYVIDFLTKESEINRENKKELYKTLAYYYEVRGERDGLITALEKTLSHTKSQKEKSRIYFILAQLYQREGFDAQAYHYYQESLKGNPPYERTFFSQLFAQQVAELEKSKDFKKVRSYYDDLYKNPKNRDLRDVVLYEKALFELKQGNKKDGIKLLHKAAQEKGSNTKQKGYIYKKLADIYFDQENDYRASKYYLDSAIQYFKPTDKNYNILSEKKETLDQYVEHYETIQNNDSLLNLSQLSPEEQEKIAEDYLSREEARLLEEKEKKSRTKSGNIFDNLLAFGDKGGGDSFYFNNPTAIQQGAVEFTQNWGNRRLEDNWRREASNFPGRGRSSEINDSSPSPGEESESELTAPSLPSKEDLMANIPNSPEAIKKLNQELEIAYFELGKLLFFELKKPLLARENLQQLIHLYPNTERKPEAYYTLFLINQEVNENPKKYVRLLNQEFPDSPYTNSVNNPEKESTSNEANLLAAGFYKKAYQNYKEKNFEKAREIIQSTLKKYPLTSVTDKLLLLEVMIIGKLDSKERYQKKLEQYIQADHAPELTKMARNMLVAISGERLPKENIKADSLLVKDTVQLAQKNEENPELQKSEAETAPYELKKGQTHLFVLALESRGPDMKKNLTGDLESFHSAHFSKSRLRTGNLSFSRDYSIIIISPFPNANKAMEYRETFIEKFKTDALSEEIKKSSFVISIENFQQLNKRKDIPEYDAFFKASYLK
ncbi:gliding motility protein [Echinicola jeungdonensis]|uniref:Gliding motility protein n=1 Tax=Echinicola jeungdonensis TaxID=709343 RepID=A0ABV5J1M9_9BACT|nr:gliding motility protein [Echinicola jeungdonensis]MDN3668575.1 gliding motility protein [Echinicola jeungdonensis]